MNPPNLDSLNAAVQAVMNSNAQQQSDSLAGTGEYLNTNWANYAVNFGGQLSWRSISYDGPLGKGAEWDFKYVDGNGVIWVKSVTSGPEGYRNVDWCLGGTQ